MALTKKNPAELLIGNNVFEINNNNKELVTNSLVLKEVLNPDEKIQPGTVVTRLRKANTWKTVEYNYMDFPLVLFQFCRKGNF